MCESLGNGTKAHAALLANTVKALNPRWFVVRSARDGGALTLLQSRASYSWLRGPLTPPELRTLAEREPSSTSCAAA